MTEEKPADKKPRQFLPGISPFRFVLWFFKWRNIQRIIFVLVCLATLIAIFYAEENWRGRRAWEKYKHEQLAKGEKLDWAAFYPPAVPDEQNFAMADFWADVRGVWEWERQRRPGSRDLWDSPTNDLRLRWWRQYLDDPGMSSWYQARSADMKAWQEYYRYAGPLPHLPKVLATTNEFPVPAQPGEPAVDVLFALGKSAPALEKLRAAGSRPYSRFPITYERKSEMLLPHLAKLKSLENFMLAWSTAELAAGRTNEAFQDVQLMFKSADSMKSEPVDISQLVRISCLDMAISAVWEGMYRRAWSESQLKSFQEKFRSYDLLGDCMFSQSAERAQFLALLDDLAVLRTGSYLVPQGQPSLSEIYYRDGTVLAWKELCRRSAIRFAPRGWFDLEKIEVSKSFDGRLSAITSNTHIVDKEQVARLTPNFRRSYLLGYSADNPSRLIERFARAQTSMNLAATACALERYALAKGAYPGKLDELAPQFIANVPREIAGGQPLNYRRSDDGRFVLYSLEMSGKDSGGTYLDAKGKRTGNWVWRYPVN